MAGVVFDAGALIAAERGDARFWALWRRAAITPRIVPATVLAQVWRSPANARLGQVIGACVVAPFTAERARLTGELCGQARTRDIVDASIVVIAAELELDILTADVGDLGRLADMANAGVRVLDIRRIPQ